MRRSIAVSRLVSWSLLLGLTLTFGAGVLSAQESVPALVLSINTTKQVEMSKKQIIAQVRNENPKVCRVNAIADNPRAVLITAIAPGSSRVVFEDNMKMTETIDVTVTTDDRAIRQQRAEEFVEHVRRTVPSATGIDVLVSDQASTIIGTAPDATSRALIGQMATGMLGPQPVINAIVLAGQEPTVNNPRVQLVELEVMVALVKRSEIRRMSFNWVNNRPDNFVASLIGTTTGGTLNFTNAIAAGAQGAAQSAIGNPNLQFGIVGDHGSFLGFLEALRTEGLVKVMAEPRVVTLSGRRAEIVSGGETPIIIATSVGSPPTVQYKPFGTTVEFTPLVLENGKIQLDVYAELSNLNAANGVNVPGVQAPGFDTRRARGTVHLDDCNTLAIGGLIQNVVNAQSSKVPILGDLPFLGTAFSSTKFEESEEELLIMVTPRLVSGMSCDQLPRRLPGRETRSPDDFELFLTQILEAPRGPRQVCDGWRFRAAHMNDPAGVYPCGDNGRSHGWGHGGGRCSSGSCASGSCGTSGQGHSGVVSGHVQVGGPNLFEGASRLPMAVDVPIRDGIDLVSQPGESSPLPMPNDAPVIPVSAPSLPRLPDSSR